MNYQRIYDQIIDRAKKENREKTKGGTYYEAHHIVPKCLGGEGSYSEWGIHPNITLLTAREHFICHWILYNLYPNTSKLVYAFNAMATLTTNNYQKRYTPSSKVVEELKIAAAAHRAVNLVEFNKTPEGRRIRREANQKVDQKAKIAKTVANTDYVKRTANTDWEARTANTDWKAKVANTDYAIIAEKNKKPILQFDKSEIFIKEWASLKEAGESLNIYSSNIANCAKGREKSAGGFIWKYRNQI